MSKLNAIRYNSFYLEDELVSKYLNIYFLINKKWYVCNAEDGEAIFLEIEYPKLISLAEIENEFKYPLFNLNDSEIIKNCIHQNIKSIEIISIGPLEIPETRLVIK